MNTRSLVLSLGSCIVIAACARTPAPASDTREADAAAIRANTNQYLDRWNARDVAALGTFLTDDVIELPPKGEPRKGRESVLESQADFLEKFGGTQSATVEEVIVAGDHAYQWGTWSLRYTPNSGGAEQVASGKWSTLEKRQPDGSWKTSRWIWNEEVPLAEPEG